jgi:hypothetical protein
MVVFPIFFTLSGMLDITVILTCYMQVAIKIIY